MRSAGSVRQCASAACSSAKVPTILVWMNSPGPSIERSTWLSAARCITTSGENVGKEPPHRGRIDDVGTLEADSADLDGDRRERFQIAGIGQLVDHQHLVVGASRSADERPPSR